MFNGSFSSLSRLLHESCYLKKSQATKRKIKSQETKEMSCFGTRYFFCFVDVKGLLNNQADNFF